MDNEINVAIEKLRDHKFYLENFTKIKSKNGGLVPFKLKEHQKDLFNTLNNHNRVMINKSRQMGFSAGVTGYFYVDTITNPGTNTALVGYNAPMVAELLDKVKTLYRTTPIKLRPKIAYDSKYEFSFPKLDSKILVLPCTDNVGRGYTFQNCLCMSGSTEVYRYNNTPITVDKLQSGESILNGNGSYSKVKRVVSRDNNEEMVKISTYGCDDLFLTKDHRVFVRNKGTHGKWKKAVELNSKDYVAYPYFQLRNRAKVLKLENNIKKGYESRSLLIKEVELTRDFGELCGWYIAEGSYFNGKISFSINKKEVGYVSELIDKTVKNYINSYKVSYSKDSETAVINLYSTSLARFFEKYFGSKCQNKKIDNCVWRWNWNFAYGLLRGVILGDGCLNFKQQTRIVTTSPILAHQIKRLFVSLRIGLVSIKSSESIRYGKQGKHRYDVIMGGKGNYKLRRKLGFELPVYNNGRARWRLQNNPGANQGGGYWKRGRFHYWGKISKVSIVKGESSVYDIILDKEPHSFVANGIVIHNCTELSAWENAEARMAGLSEAVPLTGRIVIESTPRGIGGLYHRMWIGENQYVKKRYGWWWEYTQDQMDIKLQELGPQMFAQEYGLSFLSSGRPVFEMDIIEKQQRNILKVGDKYGDYIVKEFEGLRVYREPYKEGIFAVGVDVSEGVTGGDYSSVTIWDRIKGEEVAFYKGLIAPHKLGEMLDKWGRWYNNALMVVERNHQGLTTLTTLKQLLYPALYFRPAKFDTLSYSTTDRIGWHTNRITRDILIGEFLKALREETLVIHSKELLDEMSTFIYNDNNDMVAQTSYHDDVIFSASIGFQGFKMLYQGTLDQLDEQAYMPKSYSY